MGLLGLFRKEKSEDLSNVVFLRKIFHPERSLPLEYVLQDDKFCGMMTAVVKKVKRFDVRDLWYSVMLKDQGCPVGFMYGVGRADDFAYGMIREKASEFAKEEGLEFRDVTQDPSEIITYNYHPANLPKYGLL
ncbi:MAG: hypothetical protein V1645_03095 [archaeon]